MTSRIRGLAAVSALALPAAALMALLPAAAAQASTTCDDYQVTITFADGSTTCQSVGEATYLAKNAEQVVRIICAGPAATVEAGLPLASVIPDTCTTFRPQAIMDVFVL